MQKIKRVSLLFRILFQLAFVLIPIIYLIFWIYVPFHIFYDHKMALNQMAFSANFIVPQSVQVHPLSPLTLWACFILSLIPVAIVEFILYSLIKLFRLYERAEIFALENVKHIKNVGYAMLIGQLYNPLYDAFLTALLTWRNVAGQRHMDITITFSSVNIALIIMAVVTILISWVMAEGCKLSEEQKYTI